VCVASRLLAVVLWLICEFCNHVSSFTPIPTTDSTTRSHKSLFQDQVSPNNKDQKQEQDRTQCLVRTTTDRRTLIKSLLAVTVASVPTPASSRTGRRPCRSLEDARTQLDLAVQASSVQALQDAKELINDSSLDESSLIRAFELCPNPNAPKMTPNNRETATVSVQKFRTLLNQSTALQTEDTMAAMRFGTSARVAVDAQLFQNE